MGITKMKCHDRISPHGMGFALSMAVLMCCSGYAFAEVDDTTCGSLQQANGPWDYRTAPKDIKQLVERPHFDRQYALVLRGGTRSELNTIGGDLDYTLRAFPNHPRALWALDRVATVLKVERVHMARWTLECYFLRGLRMAPDDALIYLAYAQYLQRRGRLKEARENLDLAAKYLADEGPNVANAHYNIGLAYFDLKEFDLAQDFAERAARGGFSLPGLKAKLQRGGHWKERGPGEQRADSRSDDGHAPAGPLPAPEAPVAE